MTSTYDEFTSPEREHHPFVAALVAMVPVIVLASAPPLWATWDRPSLKIARTAISVDLAAILARQGRCGDRVLRPICRLPLAQAALPAASAPVLSTMPGVSK